MNDKQFWQLVKQADWPNRNYNEVRVEFLRSLTPEEVMEFRTIAIEKKNRKKESDMICSVSKVS